MNFVLWLLTREEVEKGDTDTTGGEYLLTPLPSPPRATCLRGRLKVVDRIRVRYRRSSSIFTHNDMDEYEQEMRSVTRVELIVRGR
jgi:hypothetical protein